MRKITVSKEKGEKGEIRQEDWSTIMEYLFHQISSTMISLEGYTAILSNEYTMDLNKKGKHYLSSIRKNVREMEHAIRVLKECINKDRKLS